MVFPKSNLPTASQPWGRYLETSIKALETTTATERVNNAARDAQAALGIKRLDASVSAVAAATILAQNAADNAQEAIDAIGNLDQSTSTYKISADNVTVGTLTGITLVGNTIKTANTGTRVVLTGTNISFYNSSDIFSGSIYGSSSSWGTTMTLGSGSTIMEIGSNEIRLTADTSNVLDIGGQWYTSGVLGISSDIYTQIGSDGGSPTLIYGSGGLDVTGSRVAAYGFSIFSVGSIINSSGYVFPRNPTAATGTANVRQVGSGQELLRVTSARRYKHDIQDVDYGLKALNLRPRTWIDKNEYEKNGNSIEGLYRIPGFVAEEVEEAGLAEMLTYDYETGELAGLSYDRMVAALIPVIKNQQNIIEDLSARIVALENK